MLAFFMTFPGRILYSCDKRERKSGHALMGCPLPYDYGNRHALSGRKAPRFVPSEGTSDVFVPLYELHHACQDDAGHHGVASCQQ